MDIHEKGQHGSAESESMSIVRKKVAFVRQAGNNQDPTVQITNDPRISDKSLAETDPIQVHKLNDQSTTALHVENSDSWTKVIRSYKRYRAMNKTKPDR